MRISDWSSDVCSSDLPKIGDQPVYDLAKLEQGVAGIVRNWHDEVRDALVKQRGEHEGVVLANRYARSLPAGYVEDVSPAVAAEDVYQLSQLAGENALRMSFYHPPKDPETLRFKVYRRSEEHTSEHQSLRRIS